VAGDDSDFVVIIATWDDAADRKIDIQDFVQDGRPFIPIFSDEARFEAEAAGSGFEDKGVRIRRDLLRDLLKGDELLILNPGSDARPLGKNDL
jgi:hypothetical protein